MSVFLVCGKNYRFTFLQKSLKPVGNSFIPIQQRCQKYK
jgi:hypothetical protein